MIREWRDHTTAASNHVIDFIAASCPTSPTPAPVTCCAPTTRSPPGSTGARSSTSTPIWERNGGIPARLAAGFGIGTTTAWRHIREAVDLLPATAPTLGQAMVGIARLAYAILDGTLIRTDRVLNRRGDNRCAMPRDVERAEVTDPFCPRW